MAAKFLLNFYRAHRGVHLNLPVEFFVVGCAQIVQELAGPGTAITAIGVEARIKSKALTGNNRHQVFAGFELLKFGVILNAGQVHAINFLILQQQRFARRTEHRIPAQAADMSAMQPARTTLRRNVTVQRKRRSADRHGQQKKKYRALNPAVQRSGLNFLWLCPRALETGAYSKSGLHKYKGFFYGPGCREGPPGPLPLVTLNSR